MRRAESAADPGDEVRSAVPALERGEIEADAAKRPVLPMHATKVVAVPGGSDRAGPRPAHADAVDGPSILLIESPDAAFERTLRDGPARHGEERERERLPESPSAHGCSRTGRPVRRFTR